MYVAVFFLIFSPHHFWFLMGIFLENAFSKLVQDGTEKIMKQAARVMSHKLELYFLTNCSSFLLAKPSEPLCSTTTLYNSSGNIVSITHYTSNGVNRSLKRNY